MPVRSFLSFAGFIILVAGAYSPLLSPFGLRSFCLFELNRPYGIVMLLVAAAGVLGVILRQNRLLRLCAWLALALAVILLAGTWLRIHHTFSFIPFGALARFFTRQIRFKWGWCLIFGGPLLAITGSVLHRKNQDHKQHRARKNLR